MAYLDGSELHLTTNLSWTCILLLVTYSVRCMHLTFLEKKNTTVLLHIEGVNAEFLDLRRVANVGHSAPLYCNKNMRPSRVYLSHAEDLCAQLVH